MLRKLTLTALLALGFVAPSVGQEMVFVIRHAEKESDVEDPALTEAGRARAEGWAALLSDAEIDAVITTDARRTRETGEIISMVLEVDRTERPMSDISGIVDLLTFDYAEYRVLVVGHSETIPLILMELGVFDMVDIQPDDFGSLFIVDPMGGNEPALLRLALP